MIARELLARGIAVLEAAGVPGAPRDARLLMAHALGIDSDRVTLVLGDPIDAGAAERFEVMIARRAEREPVSHLVGHRLFWGRRYEVTPDVLDPRPETETLIEAALKVPFRKLLDLGVGSGAILLTLLLENPLAKGLGTDLSEAALAIARRNAEALGVGTRARLAKHRWFDGIEEEFDLIVANPPYIAAEEMSGLAPELGHEPRMALTDEADGLSAYREICAAAPQHLTDGGWLMVEIGAFQGHDVAALFNDAGLRGVRILRDMDGRDRVVAGRLRQIHRPFPT